MKTSQETGVSLKTKRDSGDPRVVLETAYGKYADDLYRYALMILTDHGAAEDVVQLAFMKTLKLGKRMLEIYSLNDYLRIAVRNACYGMIKRRLRLGNKLKAAPFRPLLEKLDEDTGEQHHDLIEEAIRKLPPEQREVLHMKVYEDKTFSEIGEMIGVSVNTAASRYRYGIAKLREALMLEDRMKEKPL